MHGPLPRAKGLYCGTMPQNNPVLGYAHFGVMGLLALGCSAREPAGNRGRSSAGTAAEQRDLVVTEVSSLLTVQSSSGVALSPTPRRPQPEYLSVYRLERVASTRARVDIELLFRSDMLSDERSPATLDGTFELDGLWHADRHRFAELYPALDVSANQGRWQVSLLPGAAISSDDHSEWSGWGTYGGITVGSAASTSTAPGASLAAELSGVVHPLTLRFEDNTVFVTNGTAHTFQTVLLIKSHAGGVGLRVLEDLSPGVTIETGFGPKELGYWDLLDRAQSEVQAFWANQLDDDLSRALTAARTAPWLQEYGVRAVALLDDAGAAPVDFEDASAVNHVTVLHAEVLPDDEEQRVLDALAQGSVRDAASAVQAFGRFTEAKLEVAAVSAEPAIAELATELLKQLHQP